MTSQSPEKFRVPKNAQTFLQQRFGDKLGNEIWESLEAFAVKRLRQIDEAAEYAAVIFDGQGGEVTGLDLFTADEVEELCISPDVSEDQIVACMVSLEIIHDMCVMSLQQGKHADCVKDVMEIATKALRCDN